MLSLGPGSACDVCLEPFSADLKAPCSIPCGHVFCVNCLQQVERPTCPLCRKPFNERHMIKLHIDLDTLRTSASSDEHPISSNADEDARRLQDRITLLATNGATETQTTQLTEDCKAFLATVPKTMYADLRTSVKMLIYICHVKHLYFDQQRLANQLTSKCTTLTQEVDRLKAAVEVLKIEKRRLEQAYQSVSDERDEMSTENDKLHEQLENAEAQVFLVTEWVFFLSLFVLKRLTIFADK
ncbi:hypothetical protein GGX14DRAFT_354494 [Mycena pura]|uniref:RING-type domain-containing protein n=1 Tax=Mycena pura TaxID=153505 RepID=A0AAD6VUM8_9AGAR|nr:hypothetical protein GGX14DRAFT_354494 [Mycena pura]